MWLFSGKCTSKVRLDGKTAIVTGGNTGIGKETVKDFFKRGGRVILACRNLDKGRATVTDIKTECQNENNLGQLLVSQLDLSSLTSVRKFSDSILKTEKQINLLINNAGIMACPEGKTEDGFETQFGTNHLGHFLLTLLLLPKICQSTPARIVNVSSLAHKHGSIDFDDLNWTKRRYSALGAYQSSKLANVLFTKELVRKLKENDIEGVNVYSLHPGVIRTELGRHLDDAYFRGFRAICAVIFGLFSKSPEQGAQTTIYCAVDEACATESGLYYADCAVAEESSLAKNAENGQRLWNESMKLVGLDASYDPFRAARP